MATHLGLSKYGNDATLAARMIEIADQGGIVVILARDATKAARFVYEHKLDLWPEISVHLIAD